MKKLVSLICACVLAGAYIGCLDDIAEAPLELPGDEIASPEGLGASASDARITLVWNAVPDASGYRVYRSVDNASRPARIADVTGTEYVDTDVQNGRSYYYSVATVSADGLEGPRTVEILAVPSIYSILANGGEAYTGSFTVTLTLSAPVTTEHMMIAGEASFAGAVWETYRSERSWRLEGTDGVKPVYARFRDGSGALSPVVVDSIMLDTYAMITGIAITPVPRVYTPGSTAHFSLIVEGSERGGSASLSFSDYTVVVDLYDDGRGGDATAGDGVYEADYRFPEYVRGLELTITGGFTDRAGNVAPDFEAPDKISFTDPPEPVQLIGAIDSSTTSITIKWVASEEPYFASYRIYRSTTPGVTESPGMLIRELSNYAQTSYPDGEVKEGVRYYYRIFVTNDMNETAGSNEIAARTFDGVPDAVVLDDPSSVGTDRVTLTWSENASTDFKEYRLYRSTSPGVTTTSALVATITDRERTYHDDTGLNLALNTYYYRVFVFDLGGKSSRSNEVSTATP